MSPQIKKMMAARKRELSTVKRSFPKYKPGDTVASYIVQYAVLNGPGTHVLPFDLSAYAHPATLPEGPEVVEEQ